MNMVIEIPVAPLTRKILLAKHGGVEPLHLGHRNLLYQQMCYRQEETNYLPRHQQALTTYIKIDVHRHLWEKVRSKPWQVGYHLYNLHKQEFFTYMEGATAAGAEQKASLRKFFEKYGIDEDDFSEETAYRIWKRFTKNALTVSPSDVPRLSTVGRVPLDESQALHVGAKAAELAAIYCPHIHHRTLLVIPTYIVYRYTEMTTRQAGAFLGRKFQSVSRSCQFAENALMNYPNLKEVIEYCLANVEPNATPNVLYF